MPARITDASVEAMLTREKALFLQRNPKSRALSEETAKNWLRGVPIIVHTYHGHVLQGYFGAAATRGIIATERFLARRSSCLVTVSDGMAVEHGRRFECG